MGTKAHGLPVLEQPATLITPVLDDDRRHPIEPKPVNYAADPDEAIGIICQCLLGLWIMLTRNVVLTDHQTELIKRLVSSGRYQNASEVLREGIRMIERRELQNEAHLMALREAAKTGIADIESGYFQSFDAPEW